MCHLPYGRRAASPGPILPYLCATVNCSGGTATVAADDTWKLDDVVETCRNAGHMVLSDLKFVHAGPTTFPRFNCRNMY